MRCLSISDFPGDAGLTIAHRVADVLDLRLLFQREHAVKDWMVDRKLFRFAIREHPLDYLAIKVAPVRFPPKVVDHEKSASEQIASEPTDLFIIEHNCGHAAHENKGILEQLLVHEFDDLAIGIDFHRGELVKPPGKIEIRIGVIGPPGVAAAVDGRAIFDADERETILLEFWFQLPLRNGFRAFKTLRLAPAATKLGV